MSINNVVCTKFMTEQFSPALSNANDEGFSLVSPVSIPYPNFVVTRARYFDVLINFARGLVSAGGRGIPFALTALRPLGRNPGAIHSPSRSLGAGKIHPGWILNWFAGCFGTEAAHFLSFVPEICGPGLVCRLG